MSRNYKAYRGGGGRRGGSTRLVFLAGILLVAVFFSFSAVQRYIVYGDDGKVRLELPFLQEEPPSPSAPSAIDPPNLVIENPTPKPEKQPILRALAVPAWALEDGTAMQEMERLKANAVLVDLKEPSGELMYFSELHQAEELGSATGSAVVNGVLKGLSESDVYCAARISCFADNLAPRTDETLAIITNSGYCWTDEKERTWLSPSNLEARAYLCDLVREICRLGVKEIVLDYCGFPLEGDIHYIRKDDQYNPDEFSTVMWSFLAEVRAVAEEQGVLLSVQTDWTVIEEGENAKTGQTMSGLLAYADRIWLPCKTMDERNAAAEAIRMLAPDFDTERNLIAFLSEAPEGDITGWAVTPELEEPQVTETENTDSII